MPPRPPKKKPSFDTAGPPAAAPAASTPAGWVYRSGAGGAAAAPAPAVRPAATVSVGTGSAGTGRLDLDAPLTTEDARAFEVVKRYALYAAAAGLIPVPSIDFAAIAVIELKMVRELSGVYGLPFSNDRARPIVASLIGGYTSTRIGYGMGGALLKTVPVIGPALGALAVPGFGAGLTWAIGRVFIQHFASGGTFLTLDPQLMRRYFARVLHAL